MTLQQYLSTFPVLGSPQGISKLHFCPFLDVIFPSLPLWPFLFAPFIVPYRIVFAMPEDIEMWRYHMCFRFFIMVRRSSCTPIAFWILLQTSSVVTRSLYEMFRSLLLHLISRAWILPSSSDVDKRPHQLNLEASEMVLTLHMIFSLEKAVVAGAILERILGFVPSLEMIAVQLCTKVASSLHSLGRC